MWCPSVSLSVWANAWLAGAAAPDDVLDALSQWAPRHSVTAYDSVAAGRTGLPWPDLDRRGRGVTAADAAHRGRAGRVTPAHRRRAAGARRRARTAGRAPSSSATRSPPARPSSSVATVRHGGSGARFRVRRRRTDDSEFEPEPTCVVVDGVFGAGRADARAPRSRRGRVRAAFGACERPRTRLGAIRAGAPGGDVADPRRLVEQVSMSQPGHTAFPTTPRRGRCGCWRTPPTSTRSSPSAPG